MKKTIFGIDEIHKLRVEMAERRRSMPPEEAERDFQERVAQGKRRIEALRKAKEDAIDKHAQA